MMYIINSFRSPEDNKKFQRTGVHDLDASDPYQMLNLIDKEQDVMGAIDGFKEIFSRHYWYISRNQLETIRKLCRLDPGDKKQSSYMEKLLDELRASPDYKDSFIAQAQFFSFRLKYLWFSAIFGRKLSIKERAEIEDLINHGYESYKNLFSYYTTVPIPNIELYGRIVDGFTHFCQAYFQIISPTSKNLNLIKELLELIITSELKFIPIIQPEIIGTYYSIPKMIREIALSAFILFYRNGDSKNLIPVINSILAASYEYISCYHCVEERRSFADFLLQGQRLVIDSIINKDYKSLPNNILEFPDSVQKLICDELYSNLLIDTSRLLVANKFGMDAEETPFNDAIHLKFIILNEMRKGIVVIAKYKDKILIDYLRYTSDQLQSINNDIIKLYNMFNRDIIDMHLIDKLIKKLISVRAVRFIDSLLKENSPLYILIYPNGMLWHIPWSYFISVLPRIFRSKLTQKKIGHLPVIIKIGFNECKPNMTAKNFIGLAGWKYQEEIDKSIPKRGKKNANKYFPNLNEAKAEVANLENMLMPYFNVKIDDDIDANKVINYIKELKGTSIIHLSCHGTIEAGLPILWLPGQNNIPSGIHFESMMRVSWANCQFLFFNACFGSFGEPRVGGPILGMHESLSINSIPNFLGPLWPVNDDLAGIFANEYYKSLLECNNYFLSYHNSWKKLIEALPKEQKGSVMSYQFYSL